MADAFPMFAAGAVQQEPHGMQASWDGGLSEASAVENIMINRGDAFSPMYIGTGESVVLVCGCGEGAFYMFMIKEEIWYEDEDSKILKSILKDQST